jgi:hypothetical protein
MKNVEKKSLGDSPKVGVTPQNEKWSELSEMARTLIKKWEKSFLGDPLGGG